MNSTTKVKMMAAAATCSTGLFLALSVASPAGADPVDPAVPPAPVLPVVPAPPAAATTVQAAGTDVVPAPPEGVPHLASPDALPPGSTMDRSVMGNESPNVGYLRDLWHAVQDREIGGKEALLLGLAQRGMNTPYPQQAAGPNVPITPGDVPPPPPPLPAPALPPPTP